jgi:hypothetical protein
MRMIGCCFGTPQKYISVTSFNSETSTSPSKQTCSTSHSWRNNSGAGHEYGIDVKWGYGYSAELLGRYGATSPVRFVAE